MTIPKKVELPTYEPLLTEAIKNLAVDSGIISAPVYKGSNALTDSTKDWPNGVHKNRLVKIVGDAAAGAGQIAVINDNSRNTLVIKGTWFRAIGAGAAYIILEKDLAQILREVLNAGYDISAAHPLETHDPTIEDVEAALAALALICTEARLAELDVANIPTALIVITAFVDELETRLTAARAAFLDEAISAAKAKKSTDESGDFNWDTSAFTTVETDISALFTTPLTGETRRDYSLYLDLTNAEADAAAWTKCTIRVKVKIDATNYRTVDKKEIAKTDVAAAEEPGVPIDIPPVSQDAQITAQFDVALGADQTIYYHYVKGVLE